MQNLTRNGAQVIGHHEEIIQHTVQLLKKRFYTVPTKWSLLFHSRFQNIWKMPLYFASQWKSFVHERFIGAFRRRLKVIWFVPLLGPFKDSKLNPTKMVLHLVPPQWVTNPKKNPTVKCTSKTSLWSRTDILQWRILQLRVPLEEF